MKDFMECWFKEMEGVSAFLTELESTEFFIAIDSMSLEDASRLKDVDKNDLWQYLQQSIDKDFLAVLINFYRQTKLSESRISIISQCIFFHLEEKYAGSIPLLFSQIEGVITEALVKAKALRKEGEDYIEQDNGQDKIGKNGKVKVLGLNNKIKLSKAFSSNDDLVKFFERLISIELVGNHKKSKLNNLRNNILHGSDTSFINDKNLSAKLVFCIFGLVQLLRFVEFNP
jgi:hypothetical protein